MSAQQFPCPCCGHLVFAEPPGSEDICLVCFWEDDALQLRFPELEDVTNVVSLSTAQQNYEKYGAIEERFAGDVRAATAEEPREEGFRPIAATDSFETGTPSEAGGPAEATSLYYWRPTFWRARSVGSA